MTRSSQTIESPPNPERFTNGHPVWKLRAIGQGWADGLDALARDHGVTIA
ncbi:hypothetical protein ACFZAU_39125 [Streptomyces sp. NPDC008238]